MGAVSSITNSISSALGTDGSGGGVAGAISDLGKSIASSPLAQTAITVGAAALSIPPAVTAAVLGANQASQTGNIGAGLTTGLLSYGAGTLADSALNAGSAATGAVATPVTSGTATATDLAPLASGTSGAGAALTPAQIESAVGTAGYGPSAAASAVTGAASGGSGLSNYLANIAGSANPQQAALTAIANSTGMDSATIAALSGNNAATGGTSATGGTGGLLSTGANALGSYLNYQAAKEAAQTQADAQIKAAQIAADAAKFKPVGVTTGFGSSQFGFDANGNLTSAGYQLTPQMQAQRDALLGTSGGLLQQFQDAQTATAPMGTAAQQAMKLGQGYLSTDPQAQAQKYLNDQLSLLAPSRADAMAQLQAQMQAQGRGGFAIGGGVNGQGAANPQLQALLNAQMQQNAQLAANATQGGMDYAKFGVDMTGAGGNLLSGMYGTQTAAFNPYKTALGGAQTVEGLGQNALTLGMDMGNTVTAANAKSGGLLASGMTNAANTMAPVNSTSLWGQGLLNLANQWGQ